MGLHGRLGAMEQNAELRISFSCSQIPYTFARIGAVVSLTPQDYFQVGKRSVIRFREKGGKEKEIPTDVSKLRPIKSAGTLRKGALKSTETSFSPSLIPYSVNDVKALSPNNPAMRYKKRRRSR